MPVLAAHIPGAWAALRFSAGAVQAQSAWYLDCGFPLPGWSACAASSDRNRSLAALGNILANPADRLPFPFLRGAGIRPPGKAPQSPAATRAASSPGHRNQIVCLLPIGGFWLVIR